MHDQPLSLIDRFILFYLQGKGMEQKYMAVDRLESQSGDRRSRESMGCGTYTCLEVRLRATSLRQGRDSTANFGLERRIFQGCEIDLYVGERSGLGGTGQRHSRGQIGLHVGIGDRLKLR